MPAYCRSKSISIVRSLQPLAQPIISTVSWVNAFHTQQEVVEQMQTNSNQLKHAVKSVLLTCPFLFPTRQPKVWPELVSLTYNYVFLATDLKMYNYFKETCVVKMCKVKNVFSSSSWESWSQVSREPSRNVFYLCFKNWVNSSQPTYFMLIGLFSKCVSWIPANRREEGCLQGLR